MGGLSPRVSFSRSVSFVCLSQPGTGEPIRDTIWICHVTSSVWNFSEEMISVPWGEELPYKELPYKSDGGYRRHLFGVHIRSLVYLKSKMITVRIIPIPIRVTCQKELVPLSLVPFN